MADQGLLTRMLGLVNIEPRTAPAPSGATTCSFGSLSSSYAFSLPRIFHFASLFERKQVLQRFLPSSSNLTVTDLWALYRDIPFERRFNVLALYVSLVAPFQHFVLRKADQRVRRSFYAASGIYLFQCLFPAPFFFASQLGIMAFHQVCVVKPQILGSILSLAGLVALKEKDLLHLPESKLPEIFASSEPLAQLKTKVHELAVQLEDLVKSLNDRLKHLMAKAQGGDMPSEQEELFASGPSDAWVPDGL